VKFGIATALVVMGINQRAQANEGRTVEEKLNKLTTLLRF
jgi:hypothetical protein